MRRIAIAVAASGCVLATVGGLLHSAHSGAAPFHAIGEHAVVPGSDLVQAAADNFPADLGLAVLMPTSNADAWQTVMGLADNGSPLRFAKTPPSGLTAVAYTEDSAGGRAVWLFADSARSAASVHRQVLAEVGGFSGSVYLSSDSVVVVSTAKDATTALSSAPRLSTLASWSTATKSLAAPHGLLVLQPTRYLDDIAGYKGSAATVKSFDQYPPALFGGKDPLMVATPDSPGSLSATARMQTQHWSGTGVGNATDVQSAMNAVISALTPKPVGCTTDPCTTGLDLTTPLGRAFQAALSLGTGYGTSPPDPSKGPSLSGQMFNPKTGKPVPQSSPDTSARWVEIDPHALSSAVSGSDYPSALAQLHVTEYAHSGKVEIGLQLLRPTSHPVTTPAPTHTATPGSSATGAPSSDPARNTPSAFRSMPPNIPAGGASPLPHRATGSNGNQPPPSLAPTSSSRGGSANH